MTQPEQSDTHEAVTVGAVQSAVYNALEQLGLEAWVCAVGAGAATRAVKDPSKAIEDAKHLDYRDAALKRRKR